MSRRYVQSLRHRADQSGMLLAGGNVPLTFQRTLMPRPTMDQAIVTGLTLASEPRADSLIQESIQSLALLALRRRSDTDDEGPWSRATIVARPGCGRCGDRSCSAASSSATASPSAAPPSAPAGSSRPPPGSRARPWAGCRSCRSIGDQRRRRCRSVVPAAGALAALGEVRPAARGAPRRRPPAQHGAVVARQGARDRDPWSRRGVSTLGVGERVAADGIARIAARVLPVDEALLRPARARRDPRRFGLRDPRTSSSRRFGGIESKETSVEAAFDIPPPNPLVSGSFESHVRFDTLSRQGGRYVWMVTRARDRSRGHGRGDAPSPRSGSTSGSRAPTPRRQRVALVLDELERTGAFDRKWLMVDSPTGTGYVNYAAVNALEILARVTARPWRCSTRRGRPCCRSTGSRRAGDRHGCCSTRCTRGSIASPRTGARSSCCSARASAPGRARTRSSTGARRASSTPASTTPSGSARPHFSKWKEQVLFDDRPDVDAAHRRGCSTTSTSGTRSGPEACPGPLRDDHPPRRRRRAVRARAGDPGAAVARPAGEPPVARPEGHALDADHGVLPGAGRHEELGHRRAGQVRGEGSRLPGRPAPVLPRRARLRRRPRSS